jgi:cobalt-precorrin 5A hydrolase
MKTAIIAISAAGAALAETLHAGLQESAVFVFTPHAAPGQGSFETLHGIIRELWEAYEGLVFLCASGIAVRAIAPYISSKYTDPAVVVCGDIASFAISLLSGHEGGANALAAELAALLGAVPVITTASECSPRILPRNLVAGVGCRKGSSAETIRLAFERVFADKRLSPLRVRSICTIDLKQGEPGLIEFSESLGVQFCCFSAEELNSLQGTFTSSDYVKEVTGTDNVCERAAVAGGGKGHLIVPKTAFEGVTLAVFEKEYVHG